MIVNSRFAGKSIVIDTTVSVSSTQEILYSSSGRIYGEPTGHHRPHLGPISPHLLNVACLVIVPTVHGPPANLCRCIKGALGHAKLFRLTIDDPRL